MPCVSRATGASWWGHDWHVWRSMPSSRTCRTKPPSARLGADRGIMDLKLRRQCHMLTPMLDEIDAQTERLSREEQLELARRLLNRSLSPPADAEACDLTDLLA